MPLGRTFAPVKSFSKSQAQAQSANGQSNIYDLRCAPNFYEIDPRRNAHHQSEGALSQSSKSTTKMRGKNQSESESESFGRPFSSGKSGSPCGLSGFGSGSFLITATAAQVFSSFSVKSISSLYSCRAKYFTNFSGGSPEPLSTETDLKNRISLNQIRLVIYFIINAIVPLNIKYFIESLQSY